MSEEEHVFLMSTPPQTWTIELAADGAVSFVFFDEGQEVERHELTGGQVIAALRRLAEEVEP